MIAVSAPPIARTILVTGHEAAAVAKAAGATCVIVHATDHADDVHVHHAREDDADRYDHDPGTHDHHPDHADTDDHDADPTQHHDHSGHEHQHHAERVPTVAERGGQGQVTAAGLPARAAQHHPAGARARGREPDRDPVLVSGRAILAV